MEHLAMSIYSHRSRILGAAKKMRFLLLTGLACFTLFLVAGNLLILSGHVLAKETSLKLASTSFPTIQNFAVVDENLWRGSAPNETDYRILAEAGVKTIVDLRAEEHVTRPNRLMRKLGMELVSVPMRDGQAPTSGQVQRFLESVDRSEGLVYVHCQAGVGRTGTMVGAYLVERAGSSPMSALRQNLEIGPPSLEQLAFVAGSIEEPNPVLTAFSRILDGPRRIWTYVS